jgi:uncharacterized protein YndB with AHSA1/START domain
MPTDLIHRIGIAAPAETIYRALTTEDGIRAWWTTDVTLGARVGNAAVFGFFNRGCRLLEPVWLAASPHDAAAFA